MRLLVSLLFVACSGSAGAARAQDVRAIFKRAALPAGLTVAVEPGEGELPGYKAKYCAYARFAYGQSTVGYFVFPCKASQPVETDSLQLPFVAHSNCNFSLNKNPGENLPSFYKDNYFFQLQLCPCRTVEDKNCAKLAVKINQWARQKSW